MPPSVFKLPTTPISTRSHSAQQASSSSSSSAIPSTPTSSLAVAFAASSLQSSQPQPSLPSPPSSSHKHQGTSDEESAKDKRKGKKRARPLGDDDDEEEAEEEGRDGEAARMRKADEEREEKERMVREGIRWSGKLQDEIIVFDASAKAKDPLMEFEEKNKDFMEDLMTEFHLILLEMHVWSTHRVSNLKRKRRIEIKQSLEDIQAEEGKQEANRVRLLAFMNQIQAAVEGISSIDPLTEPGRRR